MFEGLRDGQFNTLRLVTVLLELRADWAGSLIVSCSLKRIGGDLALAANVAGAACLSVDRSAETCRAALRQGTVDFVVNTLDEALRTLKNEIRKGHPLSVAMQGEPEDVLAEMLERGLQPQMFTASDSGAGADRLPVVKAARAFGALGAVLLDVDGTLQEIPEAVSAEACFARLTEERDLRVAEFAFGSSAALRGFDARVSELIPVTDTRWRWIVGAPRSFQRSPPGEARVYRRVLLVAASERDLLSKTAVSAS